MDQGRFAVLLRPQLVSELSPEQRRRAFENLERAMGIVPGGLSRPRSFQPDPEAEPFLCPEESVRVEAFYLDRYPVTNDDFRAFVAAGGYARATLWEPSVWEVIGQFVDRTGQPGPAFWRNGQPLPGEGDHPIVGLSWHEAMAYACWVGKRLPTDAEWVKAASWPIAAGAEIIAERRYPWGEACSPEHANTWGHGSNRTASVYEFPRGENPCGIRQLIGNVWEWTATRFGEPGATRDRFVLPAPMMCLRGGAYDTYFESQATSQFQSGEPLMSRRHNIGFRCALGVQDIVGVHEEAAV